MSRSFESFSHAREEKLSLKEIKEQILQESEEKRKKLEKEVSQEIINSLYEWIKIIKWDELDFLKALTTKWNQIKWLEKIEADNINEWDIIKIENWNITKNWKIIWRVISWFEKKESIKTTPLDEIITKKPTTTNTTKVSSEAPSENLDSSNSTPTPEKISTEVKEEAQVITPAIQEEISLPNTETIENPSFSTTIIISEWRPQLIWSKWDKINITRETHPEFFEQFDKEAKKVEKVAVFNNVYEIWRNEANRKNIRNKQAKLDFEKKLWDLDNEYKELLTSFIKLDDTELNKKIESIFNKIINIEFVNKTIIGKWDMTKVKEVILDNNLSKDQKLLKSYNLMRYKWLSWNSIDIEENISNIILEKEEFNDINEILNNEKIIELIKNNDRIELEKLIWDEEIVDDLLVKYAKIQSDVQKNRIEYEKFLVEINNEKRENWEEEIKLSDYLELISNMSIITYLKNWLLYKKIHSMENRWREKDSFVWIYANLSWLSKNKSFKDAFVLADKNVWLAIDVWVTLATSILTMWVWAIAARGTVLAVSRWIATTSRWQKVIAWIDASKKLSIATKAWQIWAEWVIFYETQNTLNNILYNKKWNENAWDAQEIIKSIATIWVLRWFNVLSKAGIIGKVSDKIPYTKLKTTIGILTEAGVITGVSASIDFTFGDWFEPTLEEFLQAVVLAWMFRGANATISKWKVILENRKTHTAPPKETKTNFSWKLREKYNKKIDSEFGKIIKKELKSSTSTNGEKTITMKDAKGNNIIIKETKNEYKIDWDSRIYTFKELIEKINKADKKAKIDSVLSENINKTTSFDSRNLVLWKKKIIWHDKKYWEYEIYKKDGKVIGRYKDKAGQKNDLTESEIQWLLKIHWNRLKWLDKWIQNLKKEKIQKPEPESPKNSSWKTPWVWETVGNLWSGTKNVLWNYPTSVSSLKRNPVSLWKEVPLKNKIIWAPVAVSWYEAFDRFILNNEKDIEDHISNIVLNSVQLGTLWLWWAMISDPIIDTIHGQVRDIEQRRWDMALINNIMNKLPNRNTPYELWNTLFEDRLTLLRKQLHAMNLSWDYWENHIAMINIKNEIKKEEEKRNKTTK